MKLSNQQIYDIIKIVVTAILSISATLFVRKQSVNPVS